MNLIPLITAIALLMFGAYALRQNPRRATNRVLAAVCLVAAISLALQFVARIHGDRYLVDRVSNPMPWVRARLSVIGLLCPFLVWSCYYVISGRYASRRNLILKLLPWALISSFLMIIPFTEAFKPSTSRPDNIVNGPLYTVYLGVMLLCLVSVCVASVTVAPRLKGIRQLEFKFITITFGYVSLAVILLTLLHTLFPVLWWQPFDYWGALTLLITLLSLSLALTIGQQLGFGDGRILALFAASAIFLILFITIEWRTREPMIDLKLFRNRLFSINLISGVLVFIALSGIFILLPFYLELVLGFGTRQVGLMMAVVPVLLSVSSPVSGWFSDKFGPRPVIVVGLSIIIVGAYLLTLLDEQTAVLTFILIVLPVGAGIGVFQSPNNSAVMGSVPRERLGIASSLLSVTRTLGQVAGIATLGAIWAARVMFHHGSFLPGGATTAPPSAMVAGLHDTYFVVMGLTAVALLLSVWGLIRERRGLKN
jgi:hypothetical protein